MEEQNEGAAGPANSIELLSKELQERIAKEMDRSISFCILSPRLVNLSLSEIISLYLKYNGFEIMKPPVQVFFSYDLAGKLCTIINNIRHQTEQEMTRDIEIESPLFFEGVCVLILFYRVDVLNEQAALFGDAADSRECRPGQLRYMFGIDQFDDGIYVPHSYEEISAVLPFVNMVREAQVQGADAFLKRTEKLPEEKPNEAPSESQRGN